MQELDHIVTDDAASRRRWGRTTGLSLTPVGVLAGTGERTGPADVLTLTYVFAVRGRGEDPIARLQRADAITRVAKAINAEGRPWSGLPSEPAREPNDVWVRVAHPEQALGIFADFRFKPYPP